MANRSRIAFLAIAWVIAAWIAGTDAAIAKFDRYVNNYLRVREPIELPLDRNGRMVTVTPEQLSEGKRFFESNCINCHVGGATLPNPTVTLALEMLGEATPPRDTLAGLMAFQREPLVYDGSEESLECRSVSSRWLDDDQLQNLAAFVLKAAQSAPGWGTNLMERTF
ncbi:MAG: photosystem II cytochrome PsbV2 [Cyanobacteria bacterium P01_F01_bin.33]